MAMSQKSLHLEETKWAKTQVSVGNGEKSSVASAEDLHMGEDSLNDEQDYKGSGATWGSPAKAKLRS